MRRSVVSPTCDLSIRPKLGVDNTYIQIKAVQDGGTPNDKSNDIPRVYALHK